MLTLPPLYSTHNEFFLRSVTSWPATVGRMVLGGTCRSPGPSWSAFLGCEGICEGSIVSPGRTTDASAEDILMAPDVAYTIPNGNKGQVHHDGGTFPSEIPLPAGGGDSYRYRGKIRTRDGGQGRDSPEFPSSQKNSVRFAAEESNPTTNYRLNHLLSLEIHSDPVLTVVFASNFSSKSNLYHRPDE